MNDLQHERKRILPDGGRFRVPMMAMDSMDEVQRQIAGRHRQIVDGQGEAGLALNKPGFRQFNDAPARDQLTAAYQQYEKELTDAWRGGDQAGTQEGAKSSEDEDEDEDNGGRRRRRRAQYRNERGQETGTEEWDAATGERGRAAATDAAYADYNRELESAYKKGT
jgi:hypothetical protein